MSFFYCREKIFKLFMPTMMKLNISLKQLMSIGALKFSKDAQNYFSSIQVKIFARVLQIYLVAGVVVKSRLPFMLASSCR